jgi:hypothetical protein
MSRLRCVVLAIKPIEFLSKIFKSINDLKSLVFPASHLAAACGDGGRAPAFPSEELASA